MLKRKSDQQLEDIARKQRSRFNELTSSEGMAIEWLEPHQLTKDSSIRAFANYYNEALKNAAMRNENSLMELMALLDVRSALHARKANFTSALRDSEKLIRIAPSRAAGYIRTAELFSMYGYYKRAIEVYERGLKEVQDTDERQMLKIQSDNTKNLQRTKDVDVIGRLPYDILAKIIRYVSVTDVKTAINVSQAWENQLAGIPHIWSTTRIANAMDFKGPRELTYVSRVSHHIMHLEISYVPAFVAEQLFQQIINGNFTKLARLTLHEPTFSDWIGSLDASFVSELTDLSLPNFESINTPTMTELLGMCPKLRYLRLAGSDIAPCIITRICPRVELLCMDFGDFYVPPEDSAKETQGPTGILDSCAQILSSNCHTLKELVVEFDGESDEMKSLEAIEPLKKLRSLLISCRDIQYSDQMIALLEKAPGLTDLQFEEQCSIQFYIFEAVLKLRRLKRLSFNCPEDEDMQQGEAAAFFKSIAQCGIPLRSLSFSACEFVDDDVLDAIAGITTLQHLELFAISNVSEDGIKRLFTRLEDHPSIERIELVNVAAVTDAAIRLLHRVRTLKEVHLNDLEKITSSSVQGFDKKVDVVYWAPSKR
ncbi:hypothetical protein BJV82DRAFT_584572 [Fennellomyces sp. T-0311]|nr:hypothetical protein BJV82DRAFT_584572 [Fennellomyces sp. T-0311]